MDDATILDLDNKQEQTLFKNLSRDDATGQLHYKRTECHSEKKNQLELDIFMFFPPAVLPVEVSVAPACRQRREGRRVALLRRLGGEGGVLVAGRPTSAAGGRARVPRVPRVPRGRPGVVLRPGGGGGCPRRGQVLDVVAGVAAGAVAAGQVSGGRLAPGGRRQRRRRQRPRRPRRPRPLRRRRRAVVVVVVVVAAAPAAPGRPRPRRRGGGPPVVGPVDRVRPAPGPVAVLPGGAGVHPRQDGPSPFSSSSSSSSSSSIVLLQSTLAVVQRMLAARAAHGGGGAAGVAGLHRRCVEPDNGIKMFLLQDCFSSKKKRKKRILFQIAPSPVQADSSVVAAAAAALGPVVAAVLVAAHGGGAADGGGVAPKKKELVFMF